MTSAWFLGAAHSVPQTENEVRSTVEPIRTDGVNAEAHRDPDWNEFSSDNSGELVGLTPRVKGAETTDTEKYARGDLALASVNYNAVIDNQVATSGTAAQRESAGQAGHGTMQYAESLDPVIRPGGAFGNDFFNVMKPPTQDGAGDFMNVTDTDAWNNAVAQTSANANARRAYQGSVYSAFLNG